MICRYCKIEITTRNSYASDYKVHRGICKKCRNIDKYRWEKDNPLSVKEIYNRGKSQRTNAQRYRRTKWLDQIFDHYGDVCSCCGEGHYEFLTIDHINGGGRRHRKEIGAGNLYKWVVEHNFPKEFRILCMNCNFSYGRTGYCPHKRNE